MKNATTRPSAWILWFLSDEGIEMMERPLDGDGGFQRLMGRIREGYDPKLRATLVSFDDWGAARRYASNHGEGGYQQRLRVMLGEAAREYLQQALF